MKAINPSRLRTPNTRRYHPVDPSPKVAPSSSIIPITKENTHIVSSTDNPIYAMLKSLIYKMNYAATRYYDELKDRSTTKYNGILRA